MCRVVSTPLAQAAGLSDMVSLNSICVEDLVIDLKTLQVTARIPTDLPGDEMAWADLE